MCVQIYYVALCFKHNQQNLQNSPTRECLQPTVVGTKYNNNLLPFQLIIDLK